MNLCPVFDDTCPYYDENTGCCKLENPIEDCDDYWYYNQEGE